ncbi:MAG: FKBP-type peptidyl-prolyl cis-trans isomerase [Nitrospirae bacterium]|nr:FKBP-type peptidyl-prolyl cis-trans isomerase [Nitrospirota bacterium]
MQIDITPVQTSIVGKQKETEGTEGQREKVSYSLGYITGSRIKRESMDIDPDVYVKSFKEGFAGDKPAMTDQEMRDTLATIQKDWKTKQSEQKKEAAAERNKLAEKNKKEGEAFLSENAMKEGVVTLPGGLQYKIIKEGTGKQPASTDKVKVHYRGSLINGTEFDSSYKRGAPAEFNLDKVIKGWTDALPLMKEGSKWMLYIPPDLGYGKRGGGARGKIGPNQTLIFEVELLSVEQRGQ